MTTKQTTVKVWDPLIRIGHWTLVIAFFTAYFTEDDFMTLHVWAGYIVGVYLLLRIVWGFVGGKYARFSAFLYSPPKILNYLKTLISGKPQHYVGHNPAGGIMVIALLVALAGTTLTGLKLYAVEENKGSFAVSDQRLTAQTPSIKVISETKAEKYDDDDDEVNDSKLIQGKHETDKEGEELWEELHEIFANLTLLLVFLHVAGIVASSIIDKEPLIKAMLSGKKDIDDSYQ